jgi:anti-sigma B factor antagonist
MELKFREESETAIFELIGRVHLYEVHQLREKFDEIKEMPYRKIIIDMKDVEHIDSSGLGVLIAQASKYKERQIPFILTGIRKNLEHLFRLTSFSMLFIKLLDVKEGLEYH